MDIDFLLMLQQLRASVPAGVNEMLVSVSSFVVNWLIYLPFILLWCLDKRLGYGMLLNSALCDLSNGVIKATVCAYRPSIRDARVIPYGDARSVGSSYSFPSGHTETAASILYPTAQWQWAKRRWISVIAILFVLMTGLLRTYLGMHAPQDVLMSMLECAVVLAVVTVILRAVENNPRLEGLLTAAGLALAVAAALYLWFKPYPVDLVDGVPLVDAAKAQQEGFKAIGALSALMIAGYVERHCVRFQPSGTVLMRVIVGVVGVAALYALNTWMRPVLAGCMDGRIGQMLASMITMTFGVLIYPALLRLMGGAKAEKAPQA